MLRSVITDVALVATAQTTSVSDLIRAIILGLVQGLTEFLPISSSGHLVIVPSLLGFEKPQLAFDVFLHLGTLAAVIAYFWRDLWGFILCLVAPGRLGAEETRERRRMLVLLAIGSVPAAAIGYLVQDWAEEAGKAPVQAAWLMIFTTSLMIAAELIAAARRRNVTRSLEKAHAGVTADASGQASASASVTAPAGVTEQAVAQAEAPSRRVEHLPAKKALGIGFAQALALIPGVSRSGATISVGLILGVSRETAARFSFLLSIPIIVGAALVKVGDLGQGTEGAAELAVGFVASAVSGFLAVALLLRMLRTQTLWPFIWYRLIAGAFFVVVLTAQGF